MALARPSRPAPMPGCTPLFDAAAMREADRRSAEDHAIPSILLMERAGLAAAQEILASHPGAREAVVVTGTGSNGGDGMVVARHLAEAGLSVRVLAPGAEPPRTPDAAAMTAVAASIGIHVEALDSGSGPPSAEAIVVDALLGTGARGALREPAASAVRWMAAHEGPVVALDVPSGVEADTGRAAGDCVRADLTVTFHGDLVGLRVTPGAQMAGRVVVADIGVPSAVTLGPSAWLADSGAARAVPAKAVGADKYASGAVLVVAGSPGLTGAACLAARATLRAGAGLAVVATPAAVQEVVAAHLLEVMCAPVPDEDGHLAALSVEEVLSQARRATAVALGPGIGRAEGTTDAVLALLQRLEHPVVLDADGLWHLGASPERVAGRSFPTVLTPHAGEAARLLGRERPEVDADRLACARELARRSGAIVVLKGRGTVTAAPGGEVIVDSGGSPALASAGTGDVLTGTVAAFLAKGIEPLVAAAAAVAVHARAGELAGRGDGTIASDVLEALPHALREGRG